MGEYLSDRTLAYLRKKSEAQMVDTVVLGRPTEGAYNPTSGNVDAPSISTIYSGKARFTPSLGPQTMALGDELVSWRSDTVYIPWDAPLPHRDDLITVSASKDTAIIGHVFRVTDVVIGTNFASRKMSVTQLEPSRSS